MNDWVVIRESNEKERQMLITRGLNPDEMNIMFIGKQMYIGKTRKQTDTLIAFLNSLLD